jgi:hypothetical protein
LFDAKILPNKVVAPEKNGVNVFFTFFFPCLKMAISSVTFAIRPLMPNGMPGGFIKLALGVNWFWDQISRFKFLELCK